MSAIIGGTLYEIVSTHGELFLGFVDICRLVFLR